MLRVNNYITKYSNSYKEYFEFDECFVAAIKILIVFSLY